MTRSFLRRRFGLHRLSACHPVSDALLGVEFVQTRFRLARREPVSARVLEKSLMSAQLQYNGDYNDLLVNQYLPVADMACSARLSGRSIRSLGWRAGNCAPFENSRRRTIRRHMRCLCGDRPLAGGGGHSRRDGSLEQMDTERDLLLSLRALMTRIRRLIGDLILNN
jgi:hypothetical protein